ncbi:hypothetical protein [Actinopolymorpha sp. B9G3]|uniref:hypothetical protein n=1 Tax=Actinopolymorpha sp. B9G3 TaxID=3158970 RepID=UPI0032D939EA
MTTRETATECETPTSTGESAATSPTDPKASLHARAREGNADSAVTDGETRRGWGDLVRRFVAYFDPPEIVSERRPSLAEVVRYAREAPYAPTEGALRTAGTGYAFTVAVPVYAVTYMLAWICERPARLASAAALVAAFSFTPAGAWCRSVLAVVLRWLAGLLT